ncbi:MAG: FAD-binding protein [Legionellales bacterium]|nr:FAD-binding protein [Legionellales bacterium]
MNILIIAEHDNQTLKANTANVVSAALRLSANIHLLIAGSACQQVAQQASALNDVKKILLADHPCYQHQLAESLASLIASLNSQYDFILAPASTFGKNILPRVSGLTDRVLLSDITEICDPLTIIRPIYAGNAFAKIRLSSANALLSVRTSAFSPALSGEGHAAIEALTTVFEHSASEFIRQELNVSARPELGQARVIISGGRGMQNGENFKLLEELADVLHAAIGASRAAVDAGFVPNDYQVGQTGKIVAPQLYIAVGISGAIQHLAGMKDSKVIVAINKDEEAPIFQIANYGIVGDLFKIIPELITQLKQRQT